MMRLVGSNLACVRGGRQVFRNLSFALGAGEALVVTGPNGVGKSTLARILAGLQRHAGQVLLDGRPLSRARRLRASAIVMQDVQRQLFTDSEDLSASWWPR